MNKNDITKTIFGLTVLVVCGYFIIKFTEAFFSFLGNLDTGTQGAIFAGVTPLIAIVISYFANKSVEEKRSIEKIIRPKKMELYTDFNSFMMSIFANEKSGRRPDESAMEKFFLDKSPELLTFSSNDVIKKWGKLRVGLEKKPDEEKLFLVEEFLAAIRRDLGHSKTGFKKGDILRLFVNDIDDYIK